MSPQLFENLLDRLLAEGALDVLLIPAQMKKGRPGMLLQVLAHPNSADELLRVIFRGVRQRIGRALIQPSSTCSNVKFVLSRHGMGRFGSRLPIWGMSRSIFLRSMKTANGWPSSLANRLRNLECSHGCRTELNLFQSFTGKSNQEACKLLRKTCQRTSPAPGRRGKVPSSCPARPSRSRWPASIQAEMVSRLKSSSLGSPGISGSVSSWRKL